MSCACPFVAVIKWVMNSVLNTQDRTGSPSSDSGPLRAYRKVDMMAVADRILRHTIQSSRRVDIAIPVMTERLILRSREVTILPSFWFWIMMYTARSVYEQHYQWITSKVMDKDEQTKTRYRGLGLLDRPSLDMSSWIRQLRRIFSPPANPHASFKTPPSGLKFFPDPTPK